LDVWQRGVEPASACTIIDRTGRYIDGKTVRGATGWKALTTPFCSVPS